MCIIRFANIFDSFIRLPDAGRELFIIQVTTSNGYMRAARSGAILCISYL